MNKAISLDNLKDFKEKCDEIYSKVNLNPTLDGSEAELTGVEVDGTKYKISSGSEYTLPIANSRRLGGVKPVTKTNDMTQPVGVNSSGLLFTTAGSSGLRGYSIMVDGDTYEGTIASAEMYCLDNTGKIIKIDWCFNSLNSRDSVIFMKFTNLTVNKSIYTGTLLDLQTGEILAFNSVKLNETGVEIGHVYLLLSDFIYGGH